MDANTKLKRSANAKISNRRRRSDLDSLEHGDVFFVEQSRHGVLEYVDGEQTIAQHAATLAKNMRWMWRWWTSDLLELAGKMAKDDLVDSV